MDISLGLLVLSSQLVLSLAGDYCEYSPGSYSYCSTGCCDDNAGNEDCCSGATSIWQILGYVGIAVVVGVCIAVTICCYKKHKRSKGRQGQVVAPQTQSVVTTVNQPSAPPMNGYGFQQPPGQTPYQGLNQPPAYPGGAPQTFYTGMSQQPYNQGMPQQSQGYQQPPQLTQPFITKGANPAYPPPPANY